MLASISVGYLMANLLKLLRTSGYKKTIMSIKIISLNHSIQSNFLVCYYVFETIFKPFGGDIPKDHVIFIDFPEGNK
jgi:hypothetical protein